MSISANLFAEALKRIPGGVNSPVRAFRAVGGNPLFIDRGDGALIWDADGRRYIDYVGSWGPLIFGHRDADTLAALTEAMNDGVSFGAPTAAEVELADLIERMVPSIGKVRLVSSGSEATMSAIRLARGFTGRDRIVKFDGCYHGHADSLLVKAGSGVATLGLPDSPGVPQVLAALTTVLPFNDSAALEAEFKARGGEIACVIVEPIAGNMGCVAPDPVFLQLLREWTTRSGAVLIFDEVMTGFRVARGGAQQLYGVTPDLTTLGKICGGGLPLGAYGGRSDIMDNVAPAGAVYQAGTLSGNPLAVAAGLAVLKKLDREPPYPILEALGARLETGLLEAAQSAGAPARVNRVGSMLTLFLTATPVRDFDSAKTSDTARFRTFFHGMLDRGVYLPCSQFECLFISTVHTEADIDRTIAAARDAFREVAV
ncbi:MAG TPA: glutamate-1-semialdehyde 2,1-aminomutase [Terriglobia bacterium]|nr:glutamate-1-semialdehyde 2,1-aminomutase [Terriglobia bacterium]